MRQIGINLEAKLGLTDEEYIDIAKNLGFDTVFCGIVEKDILFHRAELLAARGMTFDELHAPWDGINNMWRETEAGDDMLGRLMGTVDLCKELGAPIAVVHLSSGQTPPPPTDIGRARFIRLVEHAEKAGIKIAFENQRMLANIAWAFEEFKAAAHVGFCYDSGHEGCFTPGREYMPLFGHRLLCTHIQDNNCNFNEDLHMLPFDGKIDFGRVARQIRESGYTGSLTLEVSGKKNPLYADMSVEDFLIRAAAAIKRLRDMVDSEQ